MKGMILKDAFLMRKQWGTILFMFIVAFYMSYATTPGFSIMFPYITLFGCTLGFTTLTYDLSENRQTILFTLPLTRKQYVLAKYLFLAGTVAAFLLVAYLFLIAFHVAASVGLFQNTFLQTFMENSLMIDHFGRIYAGNALASMILGLIFIAASVPPQMYFGKDKGWIVVILGISTLSGACALAYSGWEDMPTGKQKIQKLQESLSWWLNHPTSLFILAGIICIISYILSIKLSTRILEKRDI